MFMGINFLVNLLLNSIPEEIYVVCLCLVLLGITKQIKFDYRLIVSVLVPAIVSNILRYFCNVDMSITFIAFIMTMAIAVVVAYKQISIKRILLVFACTIIACMSNAILETINYGVLTICTTVTENTLKNNALLAFASTIPYRTIEFGMVMLYIKNQKDINQKIRVNLWQQILRNKDQRFFAVIGSTFNALWIAGVTKMFAMDRVLVDANIKTAPSLLILMGAVLVPVTIYIALLYSIYNARARELYVKSLNRDALIARINIAKYYANNRNYEKVETVLNEIIERG